MYTKKGKGARERGRIGEGPRGLCVWGRKFRVSERGEERTTLTTTFLNITHYPPLPHTHSNENVVLPHHKLTVDTSFGPSTPPFQSSDNNINNINNSNNIPPSSNPPPPSSLNSPFTGFSSPSGDGPQMKSERVHVLVRIRPVSGLSKDRSVKVDVKKGAPTTGALSIKTRDKKGWLQFKFDAACGEDATQEDVFKWIQPAISQVVSGVNTTVFAYGQTGTGKTHTMLGEGLESQVSKKTSWAQMQSEISKNTAGWGVIPRSLHQLFDSLNSIGGGGGSRGGGRRGRKGSVFDTKSIVAGSPGGRLLGNDKEFNQGQGGEKVRVGGSLLESVEPSCNGGEQSGGEQSGGEQSEGNQPVHSPPSSPSLHPPSSVHGHVLVYADIQRPTLRPSQ